MSPCRERGSTYWENMEQSGNEWMGQNKRRKIREGEAVAPKYGQKAFQT